MSHQFNIYSIKNNFFLNTDLCYMFIFTVYICGDAY